MSLAYSAATAYRTQFTYNPSDYHFAWTADGWYTWDRSAAKSAAMKARNADMKAAKAAGKTVKAFSNPGQLITRGGIGSGRPQIEMVVTVYGFNVIS